MNESLKSVLALGVVVCLFGALLAWMPGVTNEVSVTQWWVRIGGPIATVLLLVPLIWAQRRKDKAPDFLARIYPGYWERDGFCFAAAPAVANGECSMHIYFQNRYDRLCTARILIRPSSGAARGRASLAPIAVDLPCGPAEFGRIVVPWPIPQELQGKPAKLDVHAGVNYPNGRGTLLRFRDGKRVGAVGMDAWREGLQIAGALVGAVVITRPARIKLTLPAGVSALPPAVVESKPETLWRLGDAVAS